MGSGHTVLYSARASRPSSSILYLADPERRGFSASVGLGGIRSLLWPGGGDRRSPQHAYVCYDFLKDNPSQCWQ